MIEPLEFEHISVEEATREINQRVRPNTVQNWEGERRPSPPEFLSEKTLEWLATLPPLVRPQDLPRLFPRVANQICEFWKRPAQCEPYLRKLTIDDRGGRKGFPPKVASELSTLASHYATVFPYRHSIWDDVLRK